MAPALDRAEGDRIDHQPRLEARLDREQPTDLLSASPSLTPERLNARFCAGKVLKNRVKVALTLGRMSRCGTKPQARKGRARRAALPARPRCRAMSAGRLQLVVIAICSGQWPSNDSGDAVELCLVDHEARVDRRRVRDDSEAEAGGPAAIRHRLADVDHLDAADRAVAGDVALDPAPHRSESRALRSARPESSARRAASPAAR